MIIILLIYFILVFIFYVLHLLMLKIWKDRLTEKEKKNGNFNAVLFSFLWIFFLKHNLMNIKVFIGTIFIKLKK